MHLLRGLKNLYLETQGDDEDRVTAAYLRRKWKATARAQAPGTAMVYPQAKFGELDLLSLDYPPQSQIFIKDEIYVVYPEDVCLPCL